MMKVCLYRGISLTSWAIRWRTWSVYSHASLWIDPEERESGGGEIEAWPQGAGGQPGGVQRHNRLGAAHTPGTEIDLYDIQGITSLQEHAVWDFAMHQVGMRYDYHGVAGFLSRRHGANNTGKWFCSELVFAALAYAGVHLLRRIEPHQVDPGLLARSPLLIEAGFVFAPATDLLLAAYRGDIARECRA